MRLRSRHGSPSARSGALKPTRATPGVPAQQGVEHLQETEGEARKGHMVRRMYTASLKHCWRLVRETGLRQTADEIISYCYNLGRALG